MKQIKFRSRRAFFDIHRDRSCRARQGEKVEAILTQDPTLHGQVLVRRNAEEFPAIQVHILTLLRVEQREENQWEGKTSNVV